MNQLNPRAAGNRTEAVLAFGLRGLRGLLILTCWALFLASLCAGQLADLAGRTAARIRVR
jgi:hypothetical protein